jgi:hypothetical protein
MPPVIIGRQERRMREEFGQEWVLEPMQPSG